MDPEHSIQATGEDIIDINIEDLCKDKEPTREESVDSQEERQAPEINHKKWTSSTDSREQLARKAASKSFITDQVLFSWNTI